MPEEAIVLAGGAGTRLRPAVPDLPKPLAPVAGRPFLHWLLDRLARQGIRRVVLATGHLGDRIAAAVGPVHAGMAVECRREAAPLGTGGALWSALEACRGERVFALNGDTWLGEPLARMAAAAPAADLVVAVMERAERGRFGGLALDGDRILGTAPAGVGGGPVNAGLYLLRRDLAARRPCRGAFSFEADILGDPAGLDLRALPTAASFLDIGTPDDYAAAATLIPRWAGAERPGGGA